MLKDGTLTVVHWQLWIAPSVAGLWWMTSLSTGAVQQISALIYGLSLFFLFTVSTTFHALAYSGRFRCVSQPYCSRTCSLLITKQVGARPDGRCDMRLFRVITDKYHKNEAFSLVKYNRRYVCNGPMIILVLVWPKSIHFWRKYEQKTMFTFSFPVTMTFDL